MDYIDEISAKYARNEILQRKARENGSHYKVFDWDKAARKKYDALATRIKQDKLCVRGERNGHKSAGGFSS